MDEQGSVNDLQFSPLAINWIPKHASGLLSDHDAKQVYTMAPADGIVLEGASVPQRIYCQQRSKHFVKFLAEREFLELQKQFSHRICAQVPSLGPEDPFQLKQNWTEGCGCAVQAYLGSDTDASKCPSSTQRKRSREKGYAADRCRRLRMSHWLDALKELLPHPKDVTKAALLDNVIDHVKYLQNQVKDLCERQLGGELTPNSFIFLEGHGHYIVQPQTLNGPLEGMIGRLINVYPSVAAELLQSRGLIVMPMNFVEGLSESMQMLDIPDKGASQISK